MRRTRIAIGWFAVGCLLPANGAFANGFFQSLSGDVQAAQGAGAPASVSAGQRVEAGTTIRTGAGGRAVLRLDDGHSVVLHENTEFRLAEYRFDRDRPGEDSMRLQLLKGGLRSVTGLMGQRSRESVTLALPQASIGLRGTDFMVMLIDSAYLSVLHGAVAIGNAAGSATFASPSIAVVAGPDSRAAPLAASDLPAAAAAAFDKLRGVAVGPGIEPR
ncbi:MAG: FecR family protein, partial [Burkholderiales bacterium]